MRAFARETQKEPSISAEPFSLAWQRPTFPGTRAPSILGAGGLNGRVRDGYACVPSAVVTRLVSS